MTDTTAARKPPRDIRIAAFVLCLYLAAPLYALPLVGLSVSLPLLGFLAFKAGGKWGGFLLERRGYVSLLLYWLWFALLLSMSVNAVMSDAGVSMSESVKYLVQFVTLLITLSLGMRLYSTFDIQGEACAAFSWGVWIMTVFVLAEYTLFGGLEGSGWSHLTRMSQNSYAIQYSAFLPFVYATVVTARGGRKLLYGFFLLLCFGAIFINGSRTGWGTTLLTLSVFALIYANATRRFYLPILLALFVPVFVAGAWMVAPEANKERIMADFLTFEELEKDKSWMIRRLQVQKSLKLFEANPILGVGPGQFRNQVIDLDLPDVLEGRRPNEFSDVSAHNSYMQFLAESGLSFMLPFCLFLVWLLIEGFRAATRLARLGEFWGAALLAGFCGLSVHLWTLSGLTTTGPWFLYGLMLAMIYRVRTAEPKAQ